MPVVRNPGVPPVRGGRKPAHARVDHGLLVELVDISEHPECIERYAWRLPVLRRCDTGAELDWPFDETQIASFLR